MSTNIDIDELLNEIDGTIEEARPNEESQNLKLNDDDLLILQELINAQDAE
jgi:hypothetical protein